MIEVTHLINQCKHGVVVAQCRCPGPKTVVIVPCPPECERWAEPETAHQP